MAAEKQDGRRERSRATRLKIIEAAHTEFVANGFHGTTMAAVAKRAGVAAQTIYFVFHTKPELISAVIDFAVMGGDDPSGIPQETDWWQAMVEERRAAEALRIFVRGSGALFERASAISEVLRRSALTDDEVRRTYEHHEHLRREGFAEVMALLAKKGKLRAGLDVNGATDVFMTVYSDATYYAMTVEHGWSHDRYIEWACDVLPTLLLA